MGILENLPEILEPIGNAASAADAQKGLKKSLVALVKAAGMDAGWVRIRLERGEVRIAPESG